MILEDFEKLLEVHGADLENWPPALRHEGRGLLATSSSARTLLNEHRDVQRLLDRIPVPGFPGLQTRVVNQPLPARRKLFLDRLVEWLLPAGGPGMHWWRPALASCLALLLGVVLGNFYNPESISTEVAETADEFEYWEDELALLSLNDYSGNGF